MATTVCSQCKRIYPSDELINYENSWVCSTCKPLFFQKLKEGLRPAGIGLWRDGKKLVFARNAELPDRCVKCNLPAFGRRLLRRLYWHPPAYYLFICVGILLYAIVALIVRKKVELNVGMCATHLQQRKNAILVSWGMVAGAVICFVIGVSLENGIFVFAGLMVLLAAMIYGTRAAQVITAAKMEGDLVWINGAHPSYLAELPPFVN